MLSLQTTNDVWLLARKLAKECRESGKTVPGVDLIIAAYAFVHGAELEHCDSHFDIIATVFQDRVKSPTH